MTRLILSTLIIMSILIQTTIGAARVTFNQDTLSIKTADNRTFHFNIEIADTPQRHQQGLMYRHSLADNHGMLFLFTSRRIAIFWMKNTYISLDMLFLGEDGYIVDIHKRAVPQSERRIFSAAPVIGVLEIKGGLSDRLGLQRGDRVLHSSLDNDAAR